MVGSSLSVAGEPARGRGWLVDRLADGRLVAALGCGSQTGFDIDYELADRLLRKLVTAAAGPGLEHGYAEVAAALGEMSERTRDDRLIGDQVPVMHVIVAVCSSEAVELSWVGHDKAYVVRGREILAENQEHSYWRTSGWDLREVLQSVPAARSVFGMQSRSIAPQGCTSETLRLPPLGPDDQLVLVSGGVHRCADWRDGMERALAKIEEVEAEPLYRELCGIAREVGQTIDEWSGPIVVVKHTRFEKPAPECGEGGRF